MSIIRVEPATTHGRFGSRIRARVDIATCLYNTGLDPLTNKEVTVKKGLKDQKM